MTEESIPIIDEFNELLNEMQALLFITRDSGLQHTAIEQIDHLLVQLEEEKSEAIAVGKEDFANFLLSCQCMANGLKAELTMWILLKECDPDKAWNELVAAQEYFRSAVKAHGGSSVVTAHMNSRLTALEQLLFPSQTFVSAGMLIKKIRCSICDKNYEDCSHISGQVYMGHFCNVVIEDLEFDHVSMVDNPSDKTCRVTGLEVDGGMRNQMTWVVEQSGKGLPSEGETVSLPSPSREEPNRHLVARVLRTAG